MSLFQFFNGKSVICPFCLAENHFANRLPKCLKCGADLPVQYVNNYKQAPPFFVQLIGWSGVGKTVYLQSLTLELKKMGRFWRDNYVCSELSESTRGFMSNVRRYESEGQMPAPNKVMLHDPYIMLLQGMERWGARILVTRDVAGENFINLNFPLEYMPYLLRVPATLMMISISDLRTKSTYSVDDLMNCYVDTLARNKQDYRSSQLKLIVVLSKADKFKTELPDDLSEYLDSDPFSLNVHTGSPTDKLFMNDYMDKLHRASLSIRGWFAEKQPGGEMLIAKANREGISLEFTLISSTGADPGPDATMLGNVNPLRVLDPYFLALDFYSK